ncbi:MAG: LL-diaminopimelate aminotransferase [Paludibacteraceae bacterium]|nr:LL-diaminopimelate aminotransferase [Paludibacteraceae bacterium]MBP5742116.1 LL-diaminopimelate aminotransferase [Paludibacteraceae bacterium]
MAHINEDMLKLPGGYLFTEIAKKVSSFKESHPQAEVISLGIGDVTQPLAPTIVKAMHSAVDEMSKGGTFRGYGPERGYEFLRHAIAENDFRARGIEIDESEIFVNDGAKSDTGNFQELLGKDVKIGVADPIYPVYVDSNAMGGRTGDLGADGRWSNVVYMPCTAENEFIPELPSQPVDVIYLCYPNNPTGTTLTRDELKRWVAYAIEHNSLIFYDSAYEAYIQSEDVPHSIYEIEGAKQVAVEFRSFSKTAGFTGVRCGYTIVPKEVAATTTKGERIALNPLWSRRQSTKFNGVSYVSQRAAEAIYTAEGHAEIRKTIDYYMRNAKLMRSTMLSLGYEVYGGKDAPYLWVRTPQGITSWGFFNTMLQNAHVVCTPGVGFGPAGEGYVRLTAFGQHESTIKALEKIKTII